MILSFIPAYMGVEGESEHNHIQVAEAQAASWNATPTTSDYFYQQLNTRAKAIYNELLSKFTGSGKATYYSGTEVIDLMGVDGVDAAAAEAYLKGNKDIYNDFCAAKDALDLDHSEIWWMDSA